MPSMGVCAYAFIYRKRNRVWYRIPSFQDFGLVHRTCHPPSVPCLLPVTIAMPHRDHETLNSDMVQCMGHDHCDWHDTTCNNLRHLAPGHLTTVISSNGPSPGAMARRMAP